MAAFLKSINFYHPDRLNSRRFSAKIWAGVDRTHAQTYLCINLEELFVEFF
jgi:hypothetical protein